MNMTPGVYDLAYKFAAALGIGLLIGAERERRKGEGPLRSPAGIRTFLIASLLGGVSWTLGGVPLSWPSRFSEWPVCAQSDTCEQGSRIRA